MSELGEKIIELKNNGYSYNKIMKELNELKKIHSDLSVVNLYVNDLFM